MSIVQMIVIAAMIGFALWLVASYNGLVALRGHLCHAFGQIDMQLRRRFDLIPELVEAARAHLGDERVTLDGVLSARQQSWQRAQAAARRPGDLDAMNELSQATGLLADALGRLMAAVNARPELMSGTQMTRLYDELTTTENRIAFARQAYNASVFDYNVAISQFPVNLVAGVFRLGPSQPLQSCECLFHPGSLRV